MWSAFPLYKYAEDFGVLGIHGDILKNKSIEVRNDQKIKEKPIMLQECKNEEKQMVFDR